MHKIAMYVTKGGEGKTTTAVLLAYELSKLGKEVCIWDADFNQGQSTIWLAPLKEGEPEAGDYLEGNKSLVEVLKKIKDRLYLLPNASSLSKSKEWAERYLNTPQGEKKLKELFKELESIGFDVLIIDMNPSLGHEERAILTYTDEIINTFQAEPLSLEGYNTFTRDIIPVLDSRELRNIPLVKNDTIILNKINEAYSTHKTIRDVFQTMGKYVLELHQNRLIADVIAINKLPQDAVEEKKQLTETDKRLLKELEILGCHVVGGIK